jgi:hypothetical protein
MRALSEADGALVIQGPTWLGFLLIAVAVFVAILAVVLARRVPRQGRLGAFLAAIVLLYGGWHLIGTRTTIEPRGYYVESIYGEEERLGWLQVNDVAAGPGMKNANADQLVLRLRNSNETSIDLAGLTPEEKARVVAYVRARLKALAR